AFQGWQLLFYDQESVKDAVNTIRKAVYIAIPSAVVIYIIVAVTTLSLAPFSVIAHHPERALAVAAKPFMGQIGFTLISLAALFSTGSAINATLFSSGYFAKGMLSKDLLPDRVGDSSKSGIPVKTLLMIGGITAVFTWFGSLSSVTSFASIAFIVVFGAMSYIAFTQRNRKNVSSTIPLIGTLGSIGFLPLMFWHLYQSEPGTFFTVLLLSAGIIAVETLYFEREVLVEEIEEVEEKVESVIEVLKKDGSREYFDRRKVEGSCIEAGAPTNVAEDIANEVEKEVGYEVSTGEIRDMVLEKLGDIEEDWVRAWREYEKEKNE
ncbi:MAG: ATP cone domain-containing protein, partial [Candidatus Aenigmatarchaeota archaeon]